MESKLLLVQVLLVGVVAAQTGQQSTFSFSDPTLQHVQHVQHMQQVRQPVQQVRQPVQQVQLPGQVQQPVAEVFQKALQHQGHHSVQPTAARVQAPVNTATPESFQHLQSSRTQPARVPVVPVVPLVPQQQPPQLFRPLPEQARVQTAQTFIQRPEVVQMRFQQPPVQQHDAQVFTRSRPPPGINVPHDAQVFVRQPAPAPALAPAPAPAPAQPVVQETFTQPQSQDQPLIDESQVQFQPEQEILRTQQGGQQDFQQVNHARPAGRSRGAPAVAAMAVRRPVLQQGVPQTVRARPTVDQVNTDESQVTQNNESDELFREQAENAKYTFASAVDDRLTDNSQVRQETRDGLNLSGLYSYSDGFYRRTVHYEADQNGYRVTKEEVEPIGDGPQPDPMGSADVATQVAGADVRYTITADDIRDTRTDVPTTRQQQFQGDFA